MKNAGLRLWDIQRQQGSGFCVGLDPHYDPASVWNEDFYASFAGHDPMLRMMTRLSELLPRNPRPTEFERTGKFLAGLCRYYFRLIEAYWSAGIRVYKPNIAFLERFSPFGHYILSTICDCIADRARVSGEEAFVILDCKRGDIDTTQLPYYAAYLTPTSVEVFPGVNGQYGFDTMTVTTWMGVNVLSPGLEYFRAGAGAIVVTRSSNPSGTTLQDARVTHGDVGLTKAQEPFRYSADDHQRLTGMLGGRPPLVHEAMLYVTTMFSGQHGLDQEGVSPIFSVIGATSPLSSGFRKIRGNGGIALVPGFGHQKGGFTNVMPLVVKSGTLKGHLGILSSSRASNFPWMTEYKGDGNPKSLESAVRRTVDEFRAAEREAYDGSEVPYPF